MTAIVKNREVTRGGTAAAGLAVPGLGHLLYQAILLNDYYLIFGCVYMLVLTVGLSLMLLDLVYPLIDPRIRANAND